eukprot:TRINITY_DN66935_c0_g1_i1.p1 TRINITY_DN66935_c0_g1~~TRINITY_DN66935_c0_g1_i1.p1  ORF type:complete len:389 (+),score=93.88 TRINITY_DN66935_c0_g1_i1:13-1179(+)
MQSARQAAMTPTTLRGSPGSSSPTPTPRRPFERLLDRRLQSVSTFVSSTGSFGSQTAREARETRGSNWSEEMPEAILFPANKPSSRADAQVLDQWVSDSFASYAKRSVAGSARDDSQLEEDLTKAVEELVPVLSIGLNEIVRQVSQHCNERGLVLEKIWRTYVELFERALYEARESLRKQKEKTSKAEDELSRLRSELEDLKARHPEQLEKLKQTLSGKFTQRQEELTQQLTHIRGENRTLKVHLDEQMAKLNGWFPLFKMYKDSRYRKGLVDKPHGDVPKNAPAEVRLCADFQRILSALPGDVRRRVGLFISSLLGFRGGAVGAQSSEALRDRKEVNVQKIAQLEAKLAELQAEEAKAKEERKRAKKAGRHSSKTESQDSDAFSEEA